MRERGRDEGRREERRREGGICSYTQKAFCLVKLSAELQGKH